MIRFLVRDRRGVLRKPSDDGNRRLGRGVSFGTIAEQTGKIMKHTAIVFDCTNEGTTVFKLRYDMAQGRVVQGVVAECAGVTELLERQAGEWFATFAREIKHHLIEEDGEVDVRRDPQLSLRLLAAGLP